MVGGPGAGGWYTGRVDIPAGASSTTQVPLTGCEVTVSGAQSFLHGTGSNVVRLRNATGGVELEVSLDGMTYTTTGCPFLGGSDLVYQSNGAISVPGITVS